MFMNNSRTRVAAVRWNIVARGQALSASLDEVDGDTRRVKAATGDIAQSTLSPVALLYC